MGASVNKEIESVSHIVAEKQVEEFEEKEDELHGVLEEKALADDTFSKMMQFRSKIEEFYKDLTHQEPQE